MYLTFAEKQTDSLNASSTKIVEFSNISLQCGDNFCTCI